jgi:hypothetical protein
VGAQRMEDILTLKELVEATHYLLQAGNLVARCAHFRLAHTIASYRISAH